MDRGKGPSPSPHLATSPEKTQHQTLLFWLRKQHASDFFTFWIKKESPLRDSSSLPRGHERVGNWVTSYQHQSPGSASPSRGTGLAFKLQQ